MSENARRGPSRIVSVAKRRVLDLFFKVDEHTIRHEKFDGSMSPEQKILVFERGDAAAALLFNPSERKVILVNQFRLPTLDKAGSIGWLTETAAGMVRKEETPEKCIIREIEEETGYQVTRLTPIAQFFSSPGGTSELIYLFYAEVRATDQVSTGGGDDSGEEDIEIVEYPLNQFLQMLANREFQDPKVIIAGQWLKDRQGRMQVMARATQPREYQVKGTDKIVGFIAGDIMDVKGVDVWVNPENTDMMMDRFFGRSMSAIIRLNGAKKVPGTTRVEEDTIGEALRREMGKRTYVKPAFVLNTTAGALEKSNGVRRIFHVAAVQGQIGEGGTATSVKVLEDCVDNVLSEIEKSSNWPPGLWADPYRSVVFPMIGTGEGGLFVGEVAEALVAKAIEFFKRHPRAHLQKIYFQAYSQADEGILADIMNDLKDELEPVRTPA